MKAIVDSRLLYKELKKISPVIKQNTVLPIFQCVKMDFNAGKLSVTATDLETTIILTMPCECKARFSVIMEFASLADVCSKIFEPITLSLEKNDVTLISDNSKFSFMKQNESNFPAKEDEEFYLTINADDEFFYSLGCANACKKNDDMALNMNTPCIHLKEKSISIVGTDAFGFYKKDFKIKGGRELKVMVPGSFAAMVKGLQSGTVSIGDKSVKVEADSMVIISRLPEGKYCGYEVILPSERKVNFKANRKDLIHSFDTVAVASSKATHLCEISFDNRFINISSQDLDYGKNGMTKLITDNSVEIEKIGVNADQIVKLLNLLDSEDVEMCFTDPAKTISIMPFGDPTTLCMLQPISIIQN